MTVKDLNDNKRRATQPSLTFIVTSVLYVVLVPFFS